MEIKSVSEEYGASVITRPVELATDSAKCEDALIHFSSKVDFDILCFIQTTSPLVLSSDIDKGIEKVISGEYESVFAGTDETWVPRWVEIDGNVSPVNWTPKQRPRRQQMPTTIIENGAFYITTRENLLKNNLRYSGKIGCVRLPLKRSFQIDTLEELDLIKALLKMEEYYE
jgi:N-acylneuraminate cytidylyltransferase